MSVKNEDCIGTCESNKKCSPIEISAIQNLSKDEIKKILMLAFGLKELIFIHFVLFGDIKKGQMLSYNKLLDTLSDHENIFNVLAKFINLVNQKLKLNKYQNIKQKIIYY